MMVMEKSKRKGLVYSTDKGRTCPKCGDPVNQCSCHQGKNRPPENGVMRVCRQTKNRKGSGVCLVTGLPLSDADLKKLAKQLKIQCGTGGTVKNGIIEIQGDHRQKLVDLLVKLGYKARLAGG